MLNVKNLLFIRRRKKISKEQIEEDLNMEIDLSSRYDYRMSEIVKIKKYMNEKDN